MQTSPSTTASPLILTGREQALSALLFQIRSLTTFLVTSHARPDGDAIGSALGVMHLLKLMGKQATVCFADPIPRAFRDLPGGSLIQRELPDHMLDAAIVLECDSVGRTGYTSLPAALTINIDHHQSGANFAGINWIDPEVPAVGAMIYELAVASGMPLTAELASCLYAAVLTDTVCFTLPTTTAATFDLARHLLELGADAAAITDAVYFSQRESKLRLLGLAIGNLQVRGQVAWTVVTQQDMTRLGAGMEDSEGIVQHLIALDGICAAALLRELPDGGGLRASLRSKGPVNVALVAEAFGGGGHRNASGCTLHGPLPAAARQVEVALQAACRLAG